MDGVLPGEAYEGLEVLVRERTDDAEYFTLLRDDRPRLARVLREYAESLT